MTARQAAIILNAVEGLGGVRLKKLLDVFGAPEKIFAAPAGALTATGIVTPVMARRILEAPCFIDADREERGAERRGIRILTLEDEGYPAPLREIYDPPVVLYVLGDLLPADLNAVGVVGSRGASYYGLSCAQSFSHALASYGLTVVSGMARGIDTASHRAALNAGGRTVAVLGSGLNQVYPPENEDLYNEIGRKGAVVSQFPLDTPPMPRNFPIRNRIISGLSLGVLVVEASQRSGALITARFALEQGRDVFAIPGKLSAETAEGTNGLIKQGARMVTEPAEILEELKGRLTLRAPGELQRFPAGTPSSGLEPRQRAILARLGDEPKDIDLLAQETGLSAPDLLAELMRLELKNAVTRLPGKTFIKG